MRIFVGGLPRSATKDDVVRLFRQFGAGEDDVVLPRDRRTRRRKGYAYVEIRDTERARAAIAVFAGFEIEGKPLTVCAAEDRPLKRSRRTLTIALATLAATLQAGSAACAAAFSGDIGLTLNPVLGAIHESFNDRRHIPPLPVPLLEACGSYGPLQLDLSGLPPGASIPSFDHRQGHTSTRLSLLSGMLRIWDPLRRLSFGIGQALYNQSTHYADPVEISHTGETQFSRVTGVNYQAAYVIPYHNGRIEGAFNYAPAMLGTQSTLYDKGYYHGRADQERAVEIDTGVRYVRPAGRRGELIFGLRYVNYTANYAERNGGLSDRNVGLLTVVGYRARL